MGRVGSKPIEIPQGVEFTLTNAGALTNVKVKGPKGSLVKDFTQDVVIEKKDNHIILKETATTKHVLAKHGTYRALIQNMITGVSKGFEKKLVWEGVGYRMQPKGQGLNIQMGYSHDVDFSPVDGISFKVENNELIISGVDKQIVGQTAANIRGIRPPEPYKGKGIRYSDEVIIRKAGKSAK